MTDKNLSPCSPFFPYFKSKPWIEISTQGFFCFGYHQPFAILGIYTPNVYQTHLLPAIVRGLHYLSSHLTHAIYPTTKNNYTTLIR